MRKITAAKLHLWGGLFGAIWVVVLGITGALLVYGKEIDRALNPKISYVTPVPKAIPIDELVAQQLKLHPGWELVRAEFPDRPDVAMELMLGDPKTREGFAYRINPYTGEVLGDTDHANQFMQHVRDLHTKLMLGGFGSAVLWLSALAMTLLSITGVMLWWKRKRFAPTSARGVVYWIDLHGAIGIYCAIFALVFGVTAMRPLPPPLVMKVPFGRLPKLVVAPGAQQMTWQQMIASAEREMPGAKVEWLGGTNYGPGNAMAFGLRYPEDHSEHPRSILFMDPYTGAVVRKTDIRQLNAVARFAWDWDMEIHTGSIFGAPSKIVAVIFSVVIPLLGITGPMIWWKRRAISELTNGKSAGR